MLRIIMLLLISVTVFLGCEKKSTVDGVKVIKIGTTGTYEPFSYYTKEGELTGYDLDVLKEAEKLMTGYRFEFIAAPWDSLFPGIDAGRFNLLANQMTSSPERERKYIINKVPYYKDGSKVVINKHNDSIKTLKDLNGKTVGAVVGSSHTKVLERFQESSGMKFNFKYYEDGVLVNEELINKRVDFTINNPVVVARRVSMFGYPIKTIGELLEEIPAIFLIQKDSLGESLAKDLDKALQQMADEGKLEELQIKWFGTTL